jgi:hypothetical protein
VGGGAAALGPGAAGGLEGETRGAMPRHNDTKMPRLSILHRSLERGLVIAIAERSVYMPSHVASCTTAELDERVNFAACGMAANCAVLARSMASGCSLCLRCVCAGKASGPVGRPLLLRNTDF